MSYYNAIIKAADRQRTRELDAARELKRRTFEVELLECFDFDETEILDLNEAQQRYATAH